MANNIATIGNKMPAPIIVQILYDAEFFNFFS